MNNDNPEIASTVDDIDASESQGQTESPTQGDGETLPTSQETIIHEDDEEQQVVDGEEDAKPSVDTTVVVNEEEQGDPERNEFSGSLPSSSPTSSISFFSLAPILLVLFACYE